MYKKHCNSNVRRNYFFNRVINVWNSLLLIVDFSTSHSFKYLIERVDFSFLCVTNMSHVLGVYVCVCVCVCVFNMLLFKGSSKRGFLPCCPVQQVALLSQRGRAVLCVCQ